MRDGDIEMLKFAIENGADVNSLNSGHLTPLHVACFHNKRLAVLALLAENAAVDIACKVVLNIVPRNYMH